MKCVPTYNPCPDSLCRVRFACSGKKIHWKVGVVGGEMLLVVVYHVTIVAIKHGLLKKFWPMVIGCVLRTAGSYII